MSITMTKLLELLPSVKKEKARNAIVRAKMNNQGMYSVFGEEVPKEIYDEFYNVCESSWYSGTLYWMTSTGAEKILIWYLEGKLPMKEGCDVSEPMPKFYEEVEKMKQEEETLRIYNAFQYKCKEHIANPEKITVENLLESINEDSAYNAIIFVEELFEELGEGKNEIIVNGITISRQLIVHEASDLRHSNPNKIGRGDYSYYVYKWTDKNGIEHSKNGHKW